MIKLSTEKKKIFDFYSSKKILIKSFFYNLVNKLTPAQVYLLKNLKKRGIIKIEKFLTEEDVYLLENLKNEYKNNTQILENLKIKESYINDKKKFHLLFKQYYLDIIKSYFGEEIINDVIVYQELLPYKINTSSYMWHHDNRSHQIKIQILLSDNRTAGSQRMQYLEKSHKHIHSRDDTRFEKVNLKKKQIFECYGNIGDAFIFDTNGIHRGFRDNEIAKERKTITLNFLSKSNFWRANKED